MKKILNLILIPFFSIIIVSNIFAGEWQLNSGKWKYYDNNGKEVKNQVIEDKGVKYLIDSSGNMISGNGSVKEFKSAYYKVNSDGSAYAAEGWSHLNNDKRRSFFKNGKLQKNKWIDSKGDFIQNDYNSSWPYYVDSNGYTYNEAKSIAIRDSKGNNIQYRVKSDGACIPLSGIEDKETSKNKSQWVSLGNGDYAFYYQGKPFAPLVANGTKYAWINADGSKYQENYSSIFCYRTEDYSGAKMLRNTTKVIDKVTYTFDNNGKATINNSGKKEKDGFLGLFGNYKQKWIQEGSDWFLMNVDGSYIKNMWANSVGDKASTKFSSANCYRADSSGKLIQYIEFEVDREKYKADGKGKATEIKSKENKKDNPSNEEKKQNSNSSGLHAKIKNYISKNGTPNGSIWVDLGGGDWGIVINGQWKTQWWDNVNNSDKWYYTGQDGLMIRSATAYAKDKEFNKLTSKESEAYKVNGIALKCYFDNNGVWRMKLDSNNVYRAEDEKEMNSLPPSQVASFLTKQEKKDIKNKKDEDVENEIAIPIEIYTKDQFYKGKFSTGQMSENEYLTNGYYIFYNKGSGKYTLYKANDTIGKTSKVIKSNTTLAKITDYLDDNDIEKSAEVKEKSGSSSSSSSKSSSKKDKKLKVTIKSGYKTKDKTVNEVEYEGSYTLPTFEEMGWEEKPKYSFSHWAVGSKKYNPGDVVDNIKANKTITAKWKKN